ncbi:MAG TPA: HAMP domain-containing sensor histidine kinase [Solirubrobacteraceae bacterium]|jgi:two-component system sensor histidine kinase MprB|nr:HAMP domain-containing sensor histidine kinase [Solirubrobacteraceae bacterium]
MTFRHRITLAATAAVAIAVLIASGLTYVFVSDQLHGQIDNSLRASAAGVQRGVIALRTGITPPPARVPPGLAPQVLRRILRLRSGAPAEGASERFSHLLGTPRSSLGQERGVFQLLGDKGQVLVPPGGGSVTLPTDARAVALARSGGPSYVSEARIGSDHLRVLTAALAGGSPARAVEIARSLNEVDHTLSDLRLILIAVALGGVAVAALLGALVSRAVVAPVSRLTAAAEHIAKTQDMTGRIPPRGGGELSRLAVSFNAMLDALEASMRALDASVRAQRQLVADTSHELRTPVASVRANIEVLQQSYDLSVEERERLLNDVVVQLEDLTELINDVIELAREDELSQAREELRLDEIVAEAIDRARLHAPHARIEAELQETVVLGDAARLARAVNNLLDNALKFSPDDSSVEVVLRDGELAVRDHGPGIDPAELPHVFDRFYRGQNARPLPGSGLGLAIVRRVAETHGGRVSAGAASGGGLVVRLWLPALPVAGHRQLEPSRV